MGRILALDLGTVTLGVAISRTGIIASSYEEFRFPDQQWHIALQEVERIVTLEQIDTIVLGLPLNVDGTDSEMTKNARKFCLKLKRKFTGVKVVYQDERWSTMDATDILLAGDLTRKKRKKCIDRIAAQVILERYLQEKGDN